MTTKRALKKRARSHIDLATHPDPRVLIATEITQLDRIAVAGLHNDDVRAAQHVLLQAENTLATTAEQLALSERRLADLETRGKANRGNTLVLVTDETTSELARRAHNVARQTMRDQHILVNQANAALDRVTSAAINTTYDDLMARIEAINSDIDVLNRVLVDFGKAPIVALTAKDVESAIRRAARPIDLTTQPDPTGARQ